MEWLWSRNTVLVLLCGCLATAWMTHGASVMLPSSRQLGPDARLRFTRQANNSSEEDGTTTSSGDTWLGANWYWLLVLLVAVFVFVLLAIICCCYKQSTSLGPTGRMQLSSMKTALPSPSLTGFTSPVSTSVGDRESYHGNLVVSPGILSTEQTPVASPQLQFTSLLQKQQQQQQHSPHNSTASRYSNRRKNQSPANSSGSEETIRHATGTPSISSFTSVSSSLNGKMSRAQSFTGVGQQPRLSRRRSGSQVKVISLSRGASSLSVTSTASNSSAQSGASNQSVHSHGAYQSDSSRHNYLSVDVQVRANCEMTEQEKNVFTAVVLAESAAKLAQSAATYEEPIVPITKSHKMRTSHTGRLYYSTAAGLRQANNGSPTKIPSSYSQPMPISHSIHFSKQINLANVGPLHSREDPVASLDNCVRDAHCSTKKPCLPSLSSNDTGDELFTPKPSLSGTIDIIRLPASSHHQSQQNSRLEKDRGRVKKSKTVASNGTDEVKKKKRHSHQTVPTAQASKELPRFVGSETPEMPPHMRNPCLPTDQPLDDTAQPTSAKQLPDSPVKLPSGNTNEQAFNKNKPSTNGGDKEEERADSCNNDEEITQKEKNSSESSGKLKRTSVSISLSSLSSGIDEFNQSQNKQGLKRQCSVPNISQSTSLSHANHISRPPSGTSVSASGYGASMDSASSIDSVNTLNNPSEHNATFSYPLRKLLEGEHDRRGATDLQFSVHDHQASGTSLAASSGMAEKAPLSPALLFVSTNGFSTSYRNSNHVTNMYGCLPSVTGLASAEV